MIANELRRKEVFARLSVSEDKHFAKWHGLPLDEMTKAELRIVIDNYCAEIERQRNQADKDIEWLISMGRYLISLRQKEYWRDDMMNAAAQKVDDEIIGFG